MPIWDNKNKQNKQEQKKQNKINLNIFSTTFKHLRR